MVMTKKTRINPNIFEVKREFSVYRPTEVVSNHKRVDPLIKSMSEHFHHWILQKKINLIYSIFENSEGNSNYRIVKLII